MDIKKAVVQNYKKIKYAELPFEKHLILIQGKNASGKTSLIEAITSCLGVKNKDTKEPIRDGEKRASTTISFENNGVNGKLIQIFTPSGNTVKITFEDGKEIRGISKVAEFIGCSDFDPMVFSHMSEKDQKETILKLSGIDLTGVDEAIKKAEENRLMAFRQKESIKPVTEDELGEAFKLSEMKEVSVIELTDKLQAMQVQKSDFLDKEKRLTVMNDRNNQISKEIEELAKKIENLKSEQAEFVKNINDLKSYLQKTTPPDDNGIREQIQNVEQTNHNIRNAKDAVRRYNEYQEAVKEHEEADTIVKEAREKKQEYLNNVKMPVTGMELTDDGLKYNGIPFKQINTAEQILIGVKIALQDPKNKLKFVFIERGSELDSESVKKLEELVDYCYSKNVKVNILVGQAKDTPQENGFFLEEGQIINK